MTVPCDYRLAARDDIDAAYQWYEAQTPGRGAAFLVELHARVDDVCAAPELYGRVRGETRATPLPNSRYVIYYRFENGRVLVLAVQHERANPRRWLGRR